MSQTRTPPSERIASSFKQLTISSNDRRLASDELCKAIEKLDIALNKAAPGVSAWHKIAGREDEDRNFWSRDIGYCNVGNNWGIALRKTSGNHNVGIYEEQVWLFKDAPPWMCTESVGKIPDLFDELIKRTDDTTKKLRARATEAEELAKGVVAATDEGEGW
jgi:hypothetical protein